MAKMLLIFLTYYFLSSVKTTFLTSNQKLNNLDNEN